ncbi:signal peptidase I [Humibacter ginsenosidimutans]|uniref:Signal peptidase I n=1 Tax=Humibacter ginsenosidimutans TaxID=2599293 RepID=A0A5B8M8Z6_9MICO|nr:signal peptidase I [Humibacter ginsenosidimutans]QDZ16534.1 signal peptidase I [Humibacter ginsenosidimutans]
MGSATAGEDARGRGASSARGRRRSRLLLLRDLAIIIVAALLVSFLVKTFLVRSFYIPSGSMENTLQINDQILVNELEPGLVPIHRGDVVVFTDPGGWLQPDEEKTNTTPIEWVLSVIGLAAPDSNNHLVKRVIGLPGDHVSCCNALGQLEVNGSPLVEPYAVIPPGDTDAASVTFDVTVPKGELWVMGDNRYHSQDSSLNQGLPGHGFVPESDVVGRAFVITWPIGHWSWLGDYPDTFRSVSGPP